MRSKRTSWICAVAGLATSTVAMSQTAAAQQADTTEGARSAIQLEEIVVTAQRRTERL